MLWWRFHAALEYSTIRSRSGMRNKKRQRIFRWLPFFVDTTARHLAVRAANFVSVTPPA
jgi:hypothetical protein